MSYIECRAFLAVYLQNKDDYIIINDLIFMRISLALQQIDKHMKLNLDHFIFYSLSTIDRKAN